MTDKAIIAQAIQDGLDDGQLLVRWVLVAEVARSDGGHHLEHRAGEGDDDLPMAWTALGMLEAGALLARDIVRASTVDTDEDEET